MLLSFSPTSLRYSPSPTCSPTSPVLNLTSRASRILAHITIILTNVTSTKEQYGPADSGMLAPPTNPRVSYPPTTEMDQEVPSVPPAQSAPVPAFVKCYSLVDKPISPPPQSPPNVIIED
ncbi:hypothetical protein V8E55_002446 [Tylopilus felleus]